jgi:hypothetical protein
MARAVGSMWDEFLLRLTDLPQDDMQAAGGPRGQSSA